MASFKRLSSTSSFKLTKPAVKSDADAKATDEMSSAEKFHRKRSAIFDAAAIAAIAAAADGHIMAAAPAQGRRKTSIFDTDPSSTGAEPGQGRRKLSIFNADPSSAPFQEQESDFSLRWWNSLEQSSEKNPEPVRVSALQVLLSFCNVPENKLELWYEKDTRKLLLDCAAVGQPEPVRRLAVAALASLAVASSNRHEIWTEARTVIVAAGAASESEGLRRQALWCLVNLCSQDTMPGEATFKQELDAMKFRDAAVKQKRLAEETADSRPDDGIGSAWWDDAADGARAIMRLSAGAQQPQELRMLAVLALTNLADQPSHRRSIWEDEELRAALLDCADSSESELLRLQAMRTMLSLANDEENKESLRRKWASLDEEGARLRAMLASPVSEASSRAYQPAKHLLNRLGIPPDEVQSAIAAVAKAKEEALSTPTVPSMTPVIDAVRAADGVDMRAAQRRSSVDESSSSPAAVRAAGDIGSAKATAIKNHRRVSFDHIASLQRDEASSGSTMPRAAEKMGAAKAPPVVKSRRSSLTSIANMAVSSWMGAAHAPAAAGSHRRSSLLSAVSAVSTDCNADYSRASSQGSLDSYPMLSPRAPPALVKQGSLKKMGSYSVNANGEPMGFAPSPNTPKKTVHWAATAEWRSDDEVAATPFRLPDSQQGRSILRSKLVDERHPQAKAKSPPKRPLWVWVWRPMRLRGSRSGRKTKSSKVAPGPVGIIVSSEGVKVVPLSLLTPELYMKETGDTRPFAIRNITDKLATDELEESSFKTWTGPTPPEDDADSDSVNFSDVHD